MNVERAGSSKPKEPTDDFVFLFPITYTLLITIPVQPSLGPFDTLIHPDEVTLSGC
jgi:hypothetical protein